MDQFINKDERFRRKLQKLYPSKNIYGLSSKDRSLYGEMSYYCRERKIGLNDYINHLGFKVIRKKRKKEFSEESILYKLSNLYPEKLIPSIGKLTERDSSIVHQIRSVAKAENMTSTQWLIFKGYGFGVSYQDSPLLKTNVYDTPSLIRLKYEFNCNFSQLAKWLNTSKQNLDQKLKRKRDTFPYWQQNELSQLERDCLKEMISKPTCEYDSENIIMRIYQSNNKNELAIFSFINEEVKCYFDNIPLDIKESLIDRGYLRYKEADFQLISLLRQDCVVEDGDRPVVQIRNKDITSKIRSRIISHNRTRKSKFSNQEEFLNYLGFQYLHTRQRSRAEIKGILEKHNDVETGDWNISVSSAEYFQILSMAHHSGHNLKTFVESFGYRYRRTRKSTFINSSVQKLKNNYVVEDKKIYLSSLDPFYNNLYAYAYKKEKSLDELIAELGFVRIHKEDLPETYSPYDWKKDVSQATFIHKEEEFIRLLEAYIIEDNKLYIHPYDPLYQKLYLYTVRHNTSINELLKEWGFERLYADEYSSKEKIGNVGASPWKENDFINEKLEDIRKIQGSLEKTTLQTEKIKRSQSLAEQLKKLYQDRCQLCNFKDERESHPLIEMENGRYYAEVHHISPISSVGSHGEDEASSELDTYKNAIVVCTYHHKFLHYHQGGYPTLSINGKNQLYFESKKGNCVEVVTDYHLIEKFLK